MIFVGKLHISLSYEIVCLSPRLCVVYVNCIIVNPLLSSFTGVTTPVVLSCCEHRFDGAQMFYALMRKHGWTASQVEVDGDDAGIFHLYRFEREREGRTEGTGAL